MTNGHSGVGTRLTSLVGAAVIVAVMVVALALSEFDASRAASSLPTNEALPTAAPTIGTASPISADPPAPASSASVAAPPAASVATTDGRDASGATIVATSEPVESTTSDATTTTMAPASTTTTTLPPAAPAPGPIADDTFPATAAAFGRLANGNVGASLSVVRGGEIVLSRASGPTVDGSESTSDSPMVVASVSKIVVAMGIARLADQGLIDLAAPVPWSDMGLDPNEGWNDVTVRELLDHRGGLEKDRYSWFTGEGTCRQYIPSLLVSPPNGSRGSWVYSNGNYCLLGLLIEATTGQPLDEALQRLVFDPVGASGIHLTTDGLLPGDLPHPPGVERLSRLGGAGTLILSTDDTAMMLGRMTAADRSVLQPPGVFTDQYGFGHTGTVDSAKACVWVLENGATVVSATIAGNIFSSGGDICDIVVPAVATDLGIGSAAPDRTP